MAQKAKGSVFILVGSILWIVSSGMAILSIMFLLIAGGFLIGILGPLLESLEWWGNVSGFLLSFGLIIGLLVLAYLTLVIVLASMCIRRRDDPSRSTFPMVVGIIFLIMALPQLFFMPWYLSFYAWVSAFLALLFPGLILIGAILNKQGSKSGDWPPYTYPPPQGYPH